MMVECVGHIHGGDDDRIMFKQLPFFTSAPNHSLKRKQFDFRLPYQTNNNIALEIWINDFLEFCKQNHLPIPTMSRLRPSAIHETSQKINTLSKKASDLYESLTHSNPTQSLSLRDDFESVCKMEQEYKTIKHMYHNRIQKDLDQLTHSSAHRDRFFSALQKNNRQQLSHENALFSYNGAINVAVASVMALETLNMISESKELATEIKATIDSDILSTQFSSVKEMIKLKAEAKILVPLEQKKAALLIKTNKAYRIAKRLDIPDSLADTIMPKLLQLIKNNEAYKASLNHFKHQREQLFLDQIHAAKRYQAFLLQLSNQYEKNQDQLKKSYEQKIRDIREKSLNDMESLSQEAQSRQKYDAEAINQRRAQILREFNQQMAALNRSRNDDEAAFNKAYKIIENTIKTQRESLNHIHDSDLPEEWLNSIPTKQEKPVFLANREAICTRKLYQSEHSTVPYMIIELYKSKDPTNQKWWISGIVTDGFRSIKLTVPPENIQGLKENPLSDFVIPNELTNELNWQLVQIEVDTDIMFSIQFSPTT